MRLRLPLILALACVVSTSALAQKEWFGLQPLHVDGNQLKDPYGNKVVLHGVMDTPSAWFNGGRWGWGENDGNVSACIDYFDKIFTAITDNSQGAYCNLFRLHLDPAWTNDPSKPRIGDGGEHNISQYNGDRLDKYLKSLYCPIAVKGLKRGLYIIMRPPGVCPQTIQVGGEYQKYLLDVWDRVSKSQTVKVYCGQIGLELANEPVNVLDAGGRSSDNALHDFFQPIVDKIRANGFKGIIWIPGTGYQSNYRSYAKYPITGDQIGYAVHNYAGWYNNSDERCNVDEAVAEFGRSVPVISTNPIVITEVDWSPLKQPREVDHYNEMGQPSYKNYGTWATASTSKWGKAYKAILDYYGNVSMTLTGTGDFIDIDDYLQRKLVTPAFKVAMEQAGLDPYEACGVACFDWYEQYAKVDYPAAERYQPMQEIPENPFEVVEGHFNPNLLYDNTMTYSRLLNTLKLKAGGCAGWRFTEETGIDLSAYNYLVVEFSRKPTSKVYLRVYDTANFWADSYQVKVDNRKMVIDLKNMKTENGAEVSPQHVRIVGIGTTADETVYPSKAYLSNDGENPITTDIPSMSSTAHQESADDTHIAPSGQVITSGAKGFHIISHADGATSKIYVK